MDWVADFYSTTGRWWGQAEARISEIDHWRTLIVRSLVAAPARILELGCGYGSTAANLSEAGYDVTAIDVSDRVDLAPDSAACFVKADFYEHDFDGMFDVVCYWDGFGVGTDADQQRLLERIGAEWLADGGRVVIEVYDPTGFTRDHGLVETKPAAPERGYHHSVGHRRSFDTATSTAIDTWWDLDGGVEHSQRLRCYPPDAFQELIAGTPLRLEHILDEGRSDWSYLAQLTGHEA